MLTIKNRGRGALPVLLALVWLSGCMPPGPRELWQGQRLIEQGNYAQALEKLRTARHVANRLVW